MPDPKDIKRTYLGDVDQHGTDENPCNQDTGRASLMEGGSRTNKQTRSDTAT